MQRKKRKQKNWIIAAVLLLFGIFMISGGVRAEEKEIVRIGFFELPGFHEYNEDGEPTGYDVDYLNLIAFYTGWEYEFVDIPSWVDAYNMLENHEIDILAPSQRNIERQEKFLLSAYPIGTEYGALLTYESNEALTYEGYEHFEGIKIGCVDSFVMRDDFLRYASKNGFEPQMIYYRDTNELLGALDNREIDAIAANQDLLLDNTKLLARYAPSSFYYMMNRSDADLMDTLNNALERLKSEHPDFENKLFEKYYKVFSLIPFTEDEMAYIEKSPVLRIGFMGGKEPVSYLDEKGEPAGILIDLINMISENTGLRFEYVRLDGGDVTMDMLLELDLDMVAGVEYSEVNMKIEQMRITNPFFHSMKVLVGKNGIQFDPEREFCLATAAGSQTLKDSLAKKYPYVNLTKYSTAADCLDAVLDGRADVMLQSQYAAEYLLNKPKYSNLTVIPQAGLEEELCLGVLTADTKAVEENRDILRLVSILDKGIDLLDESKVAVCFSANVVGTPQKLDLEDFFYQYKVNLIELGVVLFIAGLVGIAAVRIRNRHVARIRQKEKELSCLTRNLNGGVAVLRADGSLTISYVNSGFLRIMGRGEENPESLYGTAFTELVWEADRGSLASMTEPQEDTGEEYKMELRLKTLAGKPIPVILGGVYYKESKKEAVFFCVVTDISEQKDLIDKLAVERERFSMVVEQSKDIIFDYSVPDKKMVMINNFEKIFDKPEGDKIIGIQTQSDYVHPEDKKIHDKMRRNLLESRMDAAGTLRMKKRDGSYIWCEISMRGVWIDQKLVRVVGRIADVDERIRETKSLEERSRTDVLTGLLNKEAFRSRVEEYLSSDKSGNGVLLFMDIDNFKRLNDSLGHLIGDDALKDTAVILEEAFGEDSLIGRFGGDEFVVFGLGVPEREFQVRAERLREKLNRRYSEEESTNEVKVSASMGYTCMDGTMQDYMTLLKKADIALYQAKTTGKGRLVKYDQTMGVNGYINIDR